MPAFMNALPRNATSAVTLLALLGSLASAGHAQGWQAGSRAPTPQENGTAPAGRSGAVAGPYPGYGPEYRVGSSSPTGAAPNGNAGPQSIGPVGSGTTTTGNQWRSGIRQPAQTNGSNDGYHGYRNHGYGYGYGYGYGGRGYAYGGYDSDYDEGPVPLRGDPSQRYDDAYRYSNPYGRPTRNDCVNVNGAPIPC